MAFRHPALSISDVVYRLYNDLLYTRVRWSSKHAQKTGWWPYEDFKGRLEVENTYGCVRGTSWKYLRNASAARRFLIRKYARYLLVEDNGELEVWETIGEPRYEICTFGLGHNHASTNYFITNSYNPNIRRDWYFTALQKEEAVAKALEVAARRGDTNSFDRIRNSPVIEVLLPEAVRLNPQQEAGDGSALLNMFEAISETASSQGEAAAISIAATLANLH